MPVPIREVTDPRQVGRYVYQAKDAVQAADPRALREAVAVLLHHDNWRHYVDPLDERPYDWRDFRRFVEKKLETTVERLIGALPETPSLQARILKLASAPKGQPGHSNGSATTISRGRGVAYEMRRLQRERPDLAARVDTGELSTYAAYGEAGFRKPRIRVPVDSPERAVRALLRRFTRDELLAALKEADV